MRFKILAAATIISIINFSNFSFAIGELLHQEVSTPSPSLKSSKTRKVSISSYGTIKKFSFNDYIKKGLKDNQIDTRYLDFPNQRVTMNKITAGGKLIMHNHDTDQSGYIIKGDAVIEFGPKKTLLQLKEGDSFYIPRLIQHEIMAITDLEMITFNPGTVANENSRFKH